MNKKFSSLKDHFAPVGTLEALFVEKISVTLWRLKRAYRYEAGVIRWRGLHPSEGDYREEAEKINREINQNREMIKAWGKDKVVLSKNSGCPSCVGIEPAETINALPFDTKQLTDGSH